MHSFITASFLVVASLAGTTPSYDHVLGTHRDEIISSLKTFPIDQYQLVSVPNNGSYYLDAQDDVIKNHIRKGLVWESDIAALIQKWALPGTEVLDIGAHIGTHTWVASKAVGDAGRVLAFEPQPKIFQELFFNVSANQLKNVFLYNAALGHRIGEIELSPLVTGNEGGTPLVGGTGKFAQLLTIDSLNLSNVSLMKIDVEGMEDQVLEGAKETILKNQPVIIIEIQGGHSLQSASPAVQKKILSTIGTLADLGYDTEQIGGHDWLAKPKKKRDFHSLMEMSFFGTDPFFNQGDLDEIAFYKSIYDRGSDKLFGNGPERNTIPKVIHFIWVGPRDYPKKSVANVESWVKHHPDWTIKFWTDRGDRPCPVPSMEKHLITELNMEHVGPFMNKTDNPGEQADLIRYEILYKEGGIYVDHDIECYQSFDRLSRRFDFYAFLEPPHYIPGYPYAVFPTNALIGTKPHHPILKKTMLQVAALWEPIGKKFPGPHMTFVRVLNRSFAAFTFGVKTEVQSGNSENMILLPAAFLFADQKISRRVIQNRIDDYCCLGNHTFEGAWYKKPSLK